MTEAQARVLDCVRRITADGWPVSVREVTDECGFASLSTAHKHLLALERAGQLETNPRTRSRVGGWRPTPLGLQQPPPGVS